MADRFTATRTSLGHLAHSMQALRRTSLPISTIRPISSDRNELARRYHAALGMGPAQQRFTGGNALAAQVVEPLIVHLKGVRREGIAQIELQIAPRVRLHVHTLLKKLPGAAAVQLDAVERHIGVLRKQVGVVAIARRHGYADAGADHDLVSVDLETRPMHIHDLLGQGRTFIEVTQRILQNYELVAAEARDQIGSAYDAAQPGHDQTEAALAARRLQAGQRQQSKASPQGWPRVNRLSSASARRSARSLDKARRRRTR
jgi:hypothetical protein